MQRFRGHEPPAQTAAESEQLAKAVILALERVHRAGLENEAVARGSLCTVGLPRVAGELRLRVHRDEWRHDGAAKAGRQRVPHVGGQHSRNEREEDAGDEQRGVRATPVSGGAGHWLPQTPRTEKYFSSS